MMSENNNRQEEKVNSRAVKSAFWFAACNVIQRGIQFLYIPWYTRVLSTEGYGRYVSFIAWSNIIAVFATLNLSQAVFSNGMMDYREHRKEYLGSMYGLAFVSSMVSFFLFFVLNSFLFQYTSLNNSEILIMFMGTFFQMVVLLWGAYERFEFRYRLFVVLTIVVSILNPLISLTLYYGTNFGYYAFILGYTIPNIIIGIVLIIHILCSGVRLYDAGYWKYALMLAIPLIPHYFSNHILNQSDRLMIRYYYGDSFAGIYTLAYQISFAVSLIYIGVNNSMAPWSFRMLDSSREDDVKQAIKKVYMPGIYTSFVVILFAREIIEVLGSGSFIEASDIVPDLVVATYVMFLNMLVLNILFFYKKNKSVVIATMTGAVCNVVLNICFLPMLGYKIASTTTAIGFVVIFLINCFSVYRFCPGSYPYVGAVCSIAVLFTFGHVMSYLNIGNMNLLIRILVMMVLTTVVIFFYRNQISKAYSSIVHRISDRTKN